MKNSELEKHLNRAVSGKRHLLTFVLSRSLTLLSFLPLDTVAKVSELTVL